MIRLIAALALMLALPSCGLFQSIGNAIPTFGDGDGLRGQASEVGGLRFRSRVARGGQGDRAFVVSTRGAARNVPAALEAARVRALDYCLTTVGGTDIAWSLSPDRDIAATTLNDDGTVTVAGTCLTR